jgi:hypothetical protein
MDVFLMQVKCLQCFNLTSKKVWVLCKHKITRKTNVKRNKELAKVLIFWSLIHMSNSTIYIKVYTLTLTEGKCANTSLNLSLPIDWLHFSFFFFLLQT